MRAVSTIVLLFFIIGCEQLSQEKAYRDAIHQAGKDVKKVFMDNEIKSTNPTAQQVRSMFNNIYQGLLKVDIARCPDDFRAQYKRVVVASRELAEATENMPSNFGELVGYWIKQGKKSKSDYLASQAQKDFKIKMENMSLEIGELDAIAIKYE